MTMLSALPFPLTALLHFQSQIIIYLYNGHYKSLKGNLKRTHVERGDSPQSIIILWDFYRRETILFVWKDDNGKH